MSEPKMSAVLLIARGGPDQLIYGQIPRPQPGEGEALVRVFATAITPTEFAWISASRSLPTILGHELSGIVASVGPGTSSIAVGAAVYGLADFGRDGAEAEYAIAHDSELAPKPESIDYVQAAEVPLSALTAWQALFDHAQLSAGQRVLIHGGTGGVGSFAVQLAHQAGARVITTVSPANLELARRLGADEVVDYTATRFEDVVHDVAVVLDTVGGETQERSWRVLAPRGLLVSIVSPPSQEQAAAHGVRAEYFIVEPNRNQLSRIAHMIDAGVLHPVVDSVYPLSQAHEAYRYAQTGGLRGKVVLRVVDESGTGTIDA